MLKIYFTYKGMTYDRYFFTKEEMDTWINANSARVTIVPGPEKIEMRILDCKGLSTLQILQKLLTIDKELGNVQIGVINARGQHDRVAVPRMHMRYFRDQLNANIRMALTK